MSAAKFLAKVPGEIAPEARYVLEWVFAERFGFSPPVVQAEDRGDIAITLDGSKPVLSAPCIGGWGPASGRQRFRSQLQPPQFIAPDDGKPLPILFGKPEARRAPDAAQLGFDAWGTIFWLLARVEELESPVRDTHGRFAATQSFLLRHNLLPRPVADEIVRFLAREIAALWPGLVAKTTEPKTFVTCDVDLPFSRSLTGLRGFAETLAADLIRRKSLHTAAATLRNVWSAAVNDDYRHDPNNTFSWIMDRCEARGLKAAFYFACSNAPMDPQYKLDRPVIARLMSSIHARGHEIGMHGGYSDYRSAGGLASGLAKLKQACAARGIGQNTWGNRQHYLRWDMRTTPDALDAAGFAYDTSLGFADHIGFRAGTCHEFPLWSWSRRRALAIRERPLIVMEGSMFDPHYMGLAHEAAMRLVLSLKDTCWEHGGNFVLLWHNSLLRNAADREAYMRILSG